MRHVRFRAILSGFRTEIFEKFSRPRNFAFEITGDRAEIHAAAWCTACARPSEVPNICAERRHAAAREIPRDFPTEIFENYFRGRKIFRSKSHEIAPKCMPLGGAQLAYDRKRSPTTVPSVGTPRRVRFCAILDRKFRPFFAVAKFFVRNRVRSHRNPRCLTMPSLAASHRGPQTWCRASARRGA